VTTTAQATAAPVHLKMDGVSYLVKPLQDKDFGEFEAWMQDECMALAKKHVKDLAPEDRQALLAHAFSEARSLTVNTVRALEIMSSLNGASMLLWLSLRHEHADLKFETVFHWMTNPDNLEEALEKLEVLNTTDPTVHGPRRRRRSKRKRKPRKRR